MKVLEFVDDPQGVHEGRERRRGVGIVDLKKNK